MRSPRQRTVNATVVFAVLFAAGALAYSAWAALSPGAPNVDCATYALPREQWRAAHGYGPGYDEPVATRLARNIARCRLVVGRTHSEVRALLGNPDFTGSSEPHWYYRVGTRGGIVLDDDAYLRVSFAGRWAVAATPP